ncbi:MAG TPA: class I lanthipeptide [Candidatus Deferrimicrobium sp.]|nr:class I lanthipeptide [Candidatus Deferrimicrobium sp.]
MKAKKLEKKLILNKQTISNLKDGEMNKLKGGVTLRTDCKTVCISDCFTCFVTICIDCI